MDQALVAVELDAARQAQMVLALREVLGGPVAIELVETHISWVLVGAEHAWKIKKALDVGFLDFSTLERRRHFAAEELRLNRRLAPELYLGVVTVNGSIDQPCLGGPGPVLDHAVQMQAFDQRGLWDRLATRGGLDPARLDELADRLVAFHAEAPAAPVSSPWGRADRVRAPMIDNLDVLERLLGGAEERTRLGRLRTWEAAEFARIGPRLEERRRRGRVRECHGDLHLGNVATIAGRSTVFDCIEFNEDFRWIDVASEIAFLAMDLHHHGLPGLAHRFVNRYLELGGDYEALRVLRWHLVYRALVRAKIAALRAVQAPGGAAGDAARRLIELAVRFADGAAPALTIAHGPSGSGKTTGLLAEVEAGRGIRIRADVERKRLFGRGPLDRSGSPPGTGLYAPAATAATYARLLEAADAAAEGGFGALLDATYLRRPPREAARRFAQRRGLPFTILDFDTDLATLRERVGRRAARADDASDADLAVLERQLRDAEPFGPDERAFVRRFAPQPLG